MNDDKLIKKYDKQVEMYKKQLKNPTLSNWRKKIIPSAYGNVLEVGVGAGANFPFYNKDNVHVTGVDFSAKMIEAAKKTTSHFQIKGKFIVSNVEKLCFEPNTFDCIVSTLTLCSYQNPIQMLNQFNSWCKKDGNVLLLEHGLSTNTFLSTTQKIIDPIFKRVSGCHCNRDIQKLLSKSHLDIIRLEKYWQDIIYLVWAKPGKNV